MQRPCSIGHEKPEVAGIGIPGLATKMILEIWRYLMPRTRLGAIKLAVLCVCGWMSNLLGLWRLPHMTEESEGAWSLLSLAITFYVFIALLYWLAEGRPDLGDVGELMAEDIGSRNEARTRAKRHSYDLAGIIEIHRAISLPRQFGFVRQVDGKDQICSFDTREEAEAQLAKMRPESVAQEWKETR